MTTLIDSTKYESYSDEEIVRALLNRDKELTSYFLYRKSYPLFKHLFDRYYTDCNSCLELANQVYTILMIPQNNGKCKLETFSFKSSLNTWVGVVARNYCYAVFKAKIDTVPEIVCSSSCNTDDRFIGIDNSIEMDLNSINRSDIRKLLNLMPNRRYRTIIQLRYLAGKDNEYTANALGMSMDNYYNKHKLAKAQFIDIYQKEGRQ